MHCRLIGSGDTHDSSDEEQDNSDQDDESESECYSDLEEPNYASSSQNEMTMPIYPGSKVTVLGAFCLLMEI